MGRVPAEKVYTHHLKGDRYKVHGFCVREFEELIHEVSAPDSSTEVPGFKSRVGGRL
jgi:hypothetical protein